MKTPEQIADEWANHMFIGDNLNARRAIKLAIEADRQQRPTLNEEEFEEVTEAMNALVTGLDRGKEYITLKDARKAEALIRDKFGPALYDDWND